MLYFSTFSNIFFLFEKGTLHFLFAWGLPHSTAAFRWSVIEKAGGLDLEKLQAPSPLQALVFLSVNGLPSQGRALSHPRFALNLAFHKRDLAGWFGMPSLFLYCQN